MRERGEEREENEGGGERREKGRVERKEEWKEKKFPKPVTIETMK